MTPNGVIGQRSPLRSMGSLGSQSSWPDQSPSERYFRGSSFHCPPTPSPVAFPSLKTGWTGALNDAGFIAQGASGSCGAFFQPMGQPQAGQQSDPPAPPAPQGQPQQPVFWVQMPVMMHPAAPPAPAQAAPVMHAALPASAVPVVGQAPSVSDDRPVPVVQGEVVQPEALGAVAVGESQSISFAGKQLLGEALSGQHFDAISQNVGQPISGTVAGPLQTPGSTSHGTGSCNPCAWYWKPRGCASGVDCDYCHLCPDGELKRRKKLKIAEIKSGVREPAHPRPEVRRSG